MYFKAGVNLQVQVTQRQRCEGLSPQGRSGRAVRSSAALREAAKDRPRPVLTLLKEENVTPQGRACPACVNEAAGEAKGDALMTRKEFSIAYYLKLLDSIVIISIMQNVMLDDTRKISGICDFINSVIISDREMFAERMVHLKNDIGASLAKNFKGNRAELEFLLRRL